MLYEKDIIFDFVRHIYDILFRITGKRKKIHREEKKDGTGNHARM